MLISAKWLHISLIVKEKKNEGIFLAIHARSHWLELDHWVRFL